MAKISPMYVTCFPDTFIFQRIFSKWSPIQYFNEIHCWSDPDTKLEGNVFQTCIISKILIEIFLLLNIWMFCQKGFQLVDFVFIKFQTVKPALQDQLRSFWSSKVFVCIIAFIFNPVQNYNVSDKFYLYAPVCIY